MVSYKSPTDLDLATSRKESNVLFSDVAYSNMTSGDWSIVIQYPDSDFAVERVFSLTIGAAEVVVVTVRSSIPQYFTPRGSANVQRLSRWYLRW